jgi:hypothetical protein
LPEKLAVAGKTGIATPTSTSTSKTATAGK